MDELNGRKGCRTNAINSVLIEHMRKGGNVGLTENQIKKRATKRMGRPCNAVREHIHSMHRVRGYLEPTHNGKWRLTLLAIKKVGY